MQSRNTLALAAMALCGTLPLCAFAAPYAGQPFRGAPIALPKAFSAADFDKGGEGVAYRDVSPGNAGGEYRTAEDVDIIKEAADAVSAYAINNFHTGEWLAYTVEVPRTAKYDLSIKAASNYATPAAFHIEVDGKDVTGRIEVPNTGAWSKYQWIGKAGVELTSGRRVLKVVADAQYFNLAAISVLASGGTGSASTSASAESEGAEDGEPTQSSAPNTSLVAAFKAPADGATVSKTVSGSACELVAAGGTVKQVQFFVDGALVTTELYAPYNCSFDTTKLADGRHALKAVATAADGATATAQVHVNVKNAAAGSGPKNVRFVAPKSGAAIRSALYQSNGCEVTGEDIARVDFYLGATKLNSESFGPWNCNLDPAKFSAGKHRLRAVAYDAAGRSAETAVDVQVGTASGAGALSSGSGTTEFSCSFESSPTDCGFSEHAKVPGRATLVNVARDGSKAVRLHTQPGDNNIHGSGTWERNDLMISQEATDCYEGREHWWAHSVLFPSDYVVPKAGGVVMDFHHKGSGGQANFHVDAMPQGLRLRGYGGANKDDGRYEVWLGPVQRNVWYDFVYHVKWSSGSDGFMYAWVNGKLKLAHRGPTLYRGMGCYLKLANYHDGFGKPSSVIHDRIRRGNSWSAVSRTPLEGLQ